MKHTEFEAQFRLEQLRHEAKTYHLLKVTRVSLRHWMATELRSLAQKLEPEDVQAQLKSN